MGNVFCHWTAYTLNQSYFTGRQDVLY